MKPPLRQPHLPYYLDSIWEKAPEAPSEGMSLTRALQASPQSDSPAGLGAEPEAASRRAEISLTFYVLNFQIHGQLSFYLAKCLFLYVKWMFLLTSHLFHSPILQTFYAKSWHTHPGNVPHVRPTGGICFQRTVGRRSQQEDGPQVNVAAFSSCLEAGGGEADPRPRYCSDRVCGGGLPGRRESQRAEPSQLRAQAACSSRCLTPGTVSQFQFVSPTLAGCGFNET